MARVFLIHWHKDELRERTSRLREAGFTVKGSSLEGGGATKAVVGAKPDAVVIDLGRLPSHGMHAAAWLRETKSTRRLPIVFVGGAREKVAAAKKRYPDAAFATWGRVAAAIERAIRNPPADPVVPSRPDYSGTPLPKKLGIKQDSVLALINAPKDFAKTLGPLPDGVAVRRDLRAERDVIVLFVTSCAEMKRRFATAAKALAPGGGLWVAYPKKASGVETDVTQDFVRSTGLGAGLVDNKICAVDATWSGLRFMRRTKSRR